MPTLLGLFSKMSILVSLSRKVQCNAHSMKPMFECWHVHRSWWPSQGSNERVIWQRCTEQVYNLSCHLLPCQYKVKEKQIIALCPRAVSQASMLVQFCFGNQRRVSACSLACKLRERTSRVWVSAACRWWPRDPVHACRRITLGSISSHYFLWPLCRQRLQI